MAIARWDNVLVLQTSYLGDTVLTLPLLAEIKRRFPGAKLTFFCSPQGKQLAENSAAIDQVVVDDKKGIDRGWRGIWRQAMRLRQMAFTLALTPHKSFRSALILYLAHIPCRVGFRQSKGWFLFNRLVHRASERHDVERNLSLLGAFGITVEDCERRFELCGPPDVHTPNSRKVEGIKAPGERLRIGVNPGSVWATKRWGTERYARLIELLQAHWDCEVVIFGGRDDTRIAEAIQAAAGSNCINLAGKFALAELPAALATCDVFVTNDSGPMHIAVARGVPTVGLFCATTPSLGFYPYSADAVVVQKDLPCRPCSTHGGRRCPLGTEDCMRLIDPEHVVRAVKKLLKRRAGEIGHVSGCEPELMIV